MSLPVLDRLVRRSVIGELDAHFARFIGDRAEKAKRNDPEIAAMTACLVSHAVAEGHVCIDLLQWAGRELLDGEWTAPDFASWCEALSASGVVGSSGAFAPLVLEGSRLYLHRYWRYEQSFAAALVARARSSQAQRPAEDDASLAAALDRYFPHRAGGIDWQKVAAAVAATRALTVIVGGPGTGKTSTVVRALAAMAAIPRATPLRIALAAPTGKAAARLQESLRTARARLALPAEVEGLLQAEAHTVHRLLGTIPGSTRFRHDADNPLPLDVLVVDEASMLDLALAAKLIAAVPSHARLILLGDKDQLASVEAGAVLASVCETTGEFSNEAAARIGRLTGCAVPSAATNAAPLADCIVTLRENYRFGTRSGIGRFAAAACAGDTVAALALLRDAAATDLHWQAAPDRRAVVEAVAERVMPLIRAAQAGLDPTKALSGLRETGVLCALREGPWGAIALNAAVESALRSRGVIVTPERWYTGRPVMIARNDYASRLFNGDVGIALPDAKGRLRVWFDGGEKGLRSFLPSRVPPCDTAWAVTIHKAQGSEYDRVVVVLPPEPAPILTRELIYTAVTRAASGIDLHARPEVLEAALSRRVERDSGLGERLRQRESPAGC